MNNKVLVIGSINYDMIFSIDHVHERGESQSAQSVQVAGGGKGANQAVQCAKLGLRTHMVGCLGRDAAGAYLRAELEGYNVHMDYVREVEGNSGMAAVNALGDGSVYATVARGANFALAAADIDALEPQMRESAMVILQLESPVAVVCHAVQRAKACGCTVLLNAAPAVALPEETLHAVDVFIANEVEAAFYMNTPIADVPTALAQAQSFAARYGGSCIFTLGKLGAVVCAGGRAAHLPPVDVPAVETTGAGDSFVGGLAYSLAEGKDVFAAAVFASYCSAVTIGGVGAQPSMPPLAQVRELMQEVGLEYAAASPA